MTPFKMKRDPETERFVPDTTQEAWEREFDEQFGRLSLAEVHDDVTGDVKAFIRRTREEAVAEDRKVLRERIEGLRLEIEPLVDGRGSKKRRRRVHKNKVLDEVLALLTSQDEKV